MLRLKKKSGQCYNFTAIFSASEVFSGNYSHGLLATNVPHARQYY